MKKLKNIEAALVAERGWVMNRTEQIVCPVCGYQFRESHLYYPTRDKISCDDCGADFYYFREVVYSTSVEEPMSKTVDNLKILTYPTTVATAAVTWDVSLKQAYGRLQYAYEGGLLNRHKGRYVPTLELLKQW